MSSSLFTRFIIFPYIFWQATENKSQCLFKRISRGKNPKLLRCKLFYKHVKLRQNACSTRSPSGPAHALGAFAHFWATSAQFPVTQHTQLSWFAAATACKKLQFLWDKVRLQLRVLPALCSCLCKAHAKELRNLCSSHWQSVQLLKKIIMKKNLWRHQRLNSNIFIRYNCVVVLNQRSNCPWFIHVFCGLCHV